MTTIISRAEAKKKGLPHYYTNRPCKYGHVALRMTVQGYCMECNKLHKKTDSSKATYKKYRANNKAKTLARRMRR